MARHDLSSISDEDRANMLAEVTEQLNNWYENCEGGRDFVSKVETFTHDSKVASEDDGVSPRVNEDGNIVQPAYADDNSSPEGAMFNAHNEDKQAVESSYSTTEGSKPISKQDLDAVFPNDDSLFISNIEDALNRFADNIEKSERVKKARAKAKDNTTNWEDYPLSYSNDSYQDSSGKNVSYTRVKDTVDWGKVITRPVDNIEGGVERLKGYITACVINHFGLSNIRTIVVRDSSLIINNVCYIPVVEPKYRDNADIFPLDSQIYLKEGKVAPLFNWSYLSKMKNLVSIDIDDTNFVLHYVATDLHLGRRFGVSSLFSICKSLVSVTIGGDTVTYESLNKPESAPIKNRLSVAKRFWNFDDGYKISVIGATNGLQNYTFNNMKNYAMNRGNRGIFRFCCGTAVRVGLFAGAGALNLGSHLVKGVVNVFKDAVTPISESDTH